jgi:hypothetical protein
MAPINTISSQQLQIIVAHAFSLANTIPSTNFKCIPDVQAITRKLSQIAKCSIQAVLETYLKHGEQDSQCF